MFAGHVGVALAIGRAERRVNVGVFVAAALLLDLLLWLLVLAGSESVFIPGDFPNTHQAQFAFPYSHGLLSGLTWSVLAGAVAFYLCAEPRAARWRVGTLVAAAVFSHWLLDALIHQPELPLAGAASLKIGLGLWRTMPAALVLEAAIVVAGLWLFLRNCGLSHGRVIALAVLSALILVFTVVGMTVAPPPPSATAMAGASLITLLAVCSLYYGFGSRPRPGQA